MYIKKPLAAAAGAAILGVGGLTALPALASAAPARPAVTAPATGIWPAQVAGRPDLTAGSPTGYYLWHGPDGWRLEATHPGPDHVVFAGHITTDGALSYHRVGDERGDVTTLGPYDHVLSFAFNNYGHLDGLRFTVRDGSRLTFDLRVDGVRAGVASVDIGARSLHPDRVPFTVTRTNIR